MERINEMIPLIFFVFLIVLFVYSIYYKKNTKIEKVEPLNEKVFIQHEKYIRIVFLVYTAIYIILNLILIFLSVLSPLGWIFLGCFVFYSKLNIFINTLFPLSFLIILYCLYRMIIIYLKNGFIFKSKFFALILPPLLFIIMYFFNYLITFHLLRYCLL